MLIVQIMGGWGLIMFCGIFVNIKFLMVLLDFRQRGRNEKG